MLASKPDQIDAYAKAGGPLPASRHNVTGDAFWSGYLGREGVSMGIPGSSQRRCWNAGKARAKAEPGLQPPP